MKASAAFRLAALMAAGGSGGRAATIVRPDSPAPEERQAAAELSQIWFEATGERPLVRSESEPATADEAGPWFFLGETALAEARAPLPSNPDPDGFRLESQPGNRVILRGASPSGTELGVGWYAQHVLGVRWFWPGEIGEVVPSLRNWRPPLLDRFVAPAFLSRALEGDATWLRRNGLHARLPHAHNLVGVFPRELFAAHPDWFPLIGGMRYEPKASDSNWQPNLALPEVAAHAAQVANEFFDRHPQDWGFSLSENDSERFDQSGLTLEARGPLRWFRQRPDYSRVVFGFMNRVADQVAPRHPDKLLSAYAYDWCENAPGFKVRSNVVPWLTADRSQYYDPAFQRQDHDLIERWCRSGARVVGIYEYLEGGPYLIPRQTSRMLAASIQFEYRAGARAYAAEGTPNWGLDGPKLWIAAQLLWDPHQSVEALLDDYYRNFWGEAAGPMRRFDILCEQAWRNQPGLSWWLKYFNDESQARIFPAALRRQLRGLIEDARARATKPEIGARVEVVSAAFAATERFAELCEARDRLFEAVSAAQPPAAMGAAGRQLLADYQAARARVAPALRAAVGLGGMAPVKLNPYLRNDPSELAAIAAAPADARPAAASQLLLDPGWTLLAEPKNLDDRAAAWSWRPWEARGEPAEGRTIRVRRDGAGRASVRFERGKAESLFQWVKAIPGKTYRAQARFRGRVSPGNESLLILSWLDRQGHYVGQDVACQLPPGDWSGGRRLAAGGRAPPEAAWVGLGLHVYNQQGEDFAEFSEPQLSLP